MSAGSLGVDVARNFHEVSERVARAAVRAGGSAEEVMIIGAAKAVEAARIQQAIEAGLRHVGENYVQEGLARIAALGSAMTWHFIGHLQTNKVRQMMGRFEYVHSIDRASLLSELEKRASAAATTLQALIEVNLGGEATKSGAPADQVASLVTQAKLCSHVRLVGLMTMPPPLPPEAVRPFFRQLRELRDELEAKFNLALPHLSMGMTGDFEVAIEEGATMVRIGTGIFGARE